MNMLGAPKQPMVGVIDSIHLSTARDRHVVPRTPGEGGGAPGLTAARDSAVARA